MRRGASEGHRAERGRHDAAISGYPGPHDLQRSQQGSLVPHPSREQLGNSPHKTGDEEPCRQGQEETDGNRRLVEDAGNTCGYALDYLDGQERQRHRNTQGSPVNAGIELIRLADRQDQQPGRRGRHRQRCRCIEIPVTTQGDPAGHRVRVSGEIRQDVNQPNSRYHHKNTGYAPGGEKHLIRLGLATP